ncbi:uncharacterized protein LOC117813761 [Notolabrus celidotus]|uniref:uncharacterized protein LOC117813761 n=1 Tax=Notolabrus celidotus TaxID=1203425 RepID=UPI00149022FC|nr:uncharacterized protein LOC117813761 [Notolabrus celidotus]
MQPNGLMEFTLILSLAFCSVGLGQNEWTITVNRSISARRGSDVTIHCTFTCPPVQCDNKAQVIWKKRQGKTFDGKVNDANEFVFHENKTFVLERYREKTELVNKKGNKDKDCSLRIKNVTDSDGDIYVRLIAEKDQYSYYRDTVSIIVSNGNKTSPEDTANIPNNLSLLMYTTIFVPVAALVIIVILVGTLCLIKHKRKQSFTREESGYYANFSRASSNNTKSEVSCKTIDNLPEPNEVDDPVYVNTRGPLDHMDHTNNIYGNIDYS